MKNSREIFDLPYLTLEAADILQEIVSRAYQVIIKRQEDDKAEEWTNFTRNHILVLSALRIGDIRITVLPHDSIAEGK